MTLDLLRLDAFIVTNDIVRFHQPLSVCALAAVS